MESTKIACRHCRKVVPKSNLSHHQKVCPSNPDKSGCKIKTCVDCGIKVVQKNFTRHLKTCKKARNNQSASDLNNQQPQPSTSGMSITKHLSPNRNDIDEPKIKIPRVESENNSPSILGKIQNITSSACSSVVSAVGSTVNKIKNLLRNDDNLPPVSEDEHCVKERAFNNRLLTYRFKNCRGIKKPEIFLNRYYDLIISKIREKLEDTNVKVNFVFAAKYRRNVIAEDNFEMDTMYFRTENVIVYETTDLRQVLDDAKARIKTLMDEFEARGSGWSLHEIEYLELAVNRYVPFRGSSFIKLPKKIGNIKAVINVKNEDNKCFLWSILARLHPIKVNPERISHYKQYEHEFDKALDGINFPVSLDDVKKFEKRSGISVNVYSYNKKYCVYPLIVTNDEKERHVDLLYMKNEKTSHYCYIKDLARLVRQQIKKHCTRIYICKRCLQYFGRQDLLDKHKVDCNNHEAVKVILPEKEENDVLYFKQLRSKMKIPFVMYADFECILEPISTCQPPSVQTKSGSKEGEPKSYTDKYQHHAPRTFALYITYAHDHYKDPITYFGVDSGKMFVETLKTELEAILHFYRDNEKPMKPLTPEQEREFETAHLCHICGNDLYRIDNRGNLIRDAVQDHDHLTGEFRGAAHSSCNLNYKYPPFIPIFIHNLSGYDTHLFVKMLRLNDETMIEVIPNNEERYISFTVNFGIGIKARFLDSFKFTLDPLDTLASNLSKDQFKHTTKFTDADKLDLLVKKGVYPYDYMDSDEKYFETSLPSKECFYNKLNKRDIKDEDFSHAVNVWNTFGIRDMKEYTLLYNKTDVLLLADVMENFRDICIQTYSLDPAWYFTTPGLAWSAMLKYTGIELQLLTDYDMILMVTKGIRGGLSQCCNRYSKANNPYMGEEYDKDSLTSYLIYLDAVNLYGWSMSQCMPYVHFKWYEGDIDVTQIDDDSPNGYILEVDLEYPQELHDSHSELPLAMEKRAPPGSKEIKLLTTLYDKEKYVLHYRNLKLYISLGMRLKKVHRVLEFKQSKWLKPYIELNMEMWKKSDNKSSKQFFKLMNNSVYGKTCENIRNRVDIRLATQEKQIDRWIAKPHFKHRTIFSENLAVVHMRKRTLLFNKAIYVGMCILDVSKTLIYDFHYNFFKVKYGENAKLQYTDTDSLEYLVHCDDVYKDIKETIDRYDTSNFKKKNRWGIPRVNKKKLGTMKDEFGGKIPYEYVGLRSKMYANRAEDKMETKKSKGVKKSVIKNEITFTDYKRCLLENVELYKSMNMIRSSKHELYSVELFKKVLSATDDKRYILEDGITSLPWGHYRIPKEEVVELDIDAALNVE